MEIRRSKVRSENREYALFQENFITTVEWKLRMAGRDPFFFAIIWTIFAEAKSSPEPLMSVKT
jgi:hypothetical protein